MSALTRYATLALLLALAALAPRVAERAERRDELERQRTTRVELQARNNQLEVDIDRRRKALHALADDPYVLERRAREEHALVLPNELVLEFARPATDGHARLDRTGDSSIQRR